MKKNEGMAQGPGAIGLAVLNARQLDEVLAEARRRGLPELKWMTLPRQPSLRNGGAPARARKRRTRGLRSAKLPRRLVSGRTYSASTRAHAPLQQSRLRASIGPPPGAAGSPDHRASSAVLKRDRSARAGHGSRRERRACAAASAGSCSAALPQSLALMPMKELRLRGSGLVDWPGPPWLAHDIGRQPLPPQVGLEALLVMTRMDRVGRPASYDYR
jgi:hypothetical protein